MSSTMKRKADGSPSERPAKRFIPSSPEEGELDDSMPLQPADVKASPADRQSTRSPSPGKPKAPAMETFKPKIAFPFKKAKDTLPPKVDLQMDKAQASPIQETKEEGEAEDTMNGSGREKPNDSRYYDEHNRNRRRPETPPRERRREAHPLPPPPQFDTWASEPSRHPGHTRDDRRRGDSWRDRYEPPPVARYEYDAYRPSASAHRNRSRSRSYSPPGGRNGRPWDARSQNVGRRGNRDSRPFYQEDPRFPHLHRNDRSSPSRPSSPPNHRRRSPSNAPSGSRHGYSEAGSPRPASTEPRPPQGTPPRGSPDSPPPPPPIVHALPRKPVLDRPPLHGAPESNFSPPSTAAAPPPSHVHQNGHTKEKSFPKDADSERAKEKKAAVPPPPPKPPKIPQTFSKKQESENYGRTFLGCGDIVDYEVSTKLGEGTFGVVHKAYHRLSKRQVALKRVMFHNAKEGMPITALREIKILKSLDHYCVISLLDMIIVKVTAKEPQIYMVFPYMDHDLAGLLENDKVKLSPSQIKLYMKQLLEGTEYLHRNQIIHRDMKAANLLIDNKGSLKIADFGLARPVAGPEQLKSNRQERYTNCVVTRWYRPPELLLGAREYGGEIDLWGIGCILGEMFTRRPILTGDSDFNQLIAIWKLCGTPTNESWPGWDALPGCEGVKIFQRWPRILRSHFSDLTPETVDLIDKLLTVNPKQRITAAQALDHDYLWTDPLPADPKTLPQYEASHEFTKSTRKKEPNPHLVNNHNNNRPLMEPDAPRGPSVPHTLPQPLILRDNTRPPTRESFRPNFGPPHPGGGWRPPGPHIPNGMQQRRHDSRPFGPPPPLPSGLPSRPMANMPNRSGNWNPNTPPPNRHPQPGGPPNFSRNGHPPRPPLHNGPSYQGDSLPYG
ncbi:Pkinase-domain-containing protein [Sistotremastrum niveocremeum HHB9708]|uniref:Pkinase-domain-containing protein n=1 Tax=Sistotremastrum niveocremeum HHB9708 TaxID=1314777 RepID=A0A164TTL2_9AGAM|nr:Pkinase-domain-containing protein [Sistotremastrum niveocremeum HHB9708]